MHGRRTQNNTVQCAAAGAATAGREYPLRLYVLETYGRTYKSELIPSGVLKEPCKLFPFTALSSPTVLRPAATEGQVYTRWPRLAISTMGFP